MHSFRVDGIDHELRVVRFDGHEGLSELFVFDISLASSERDLAFDAIVGQPAALEIRSGDGVRHVHGIVSDFEQGDEGKKLTAYRAVLVPAVWTLRSRRGSRIFQAVTVREIIEKVLGDAGIPAEGYRFALRASYKPREYCVQYRETDWSFLCRLMEEEGIAHFFEHTEGGHTLVFADNVAAYGPLVGKETIAYRTAGGALLQDEHVERFHWAQRIRSGKVTLRDYDFKKPTLSLERVAPGNGKLEVYDYPGEYDDPGEGARLAEVRLEELVTSRRTGEGVGVTPRLVPGVTFTLTDHPRDDFNQKYLVTRVEHHGFGPDAGGPGDRAYENRFDVVPAGVPFRPAVVTPRPAVRGVQTAFVVGPKGEEIYTDQHGRIKVRFHWDREAKGDETSSCWVRVSQISAGSAWGAVFLPRVGHEVVVDFIEGDPDRPLVVGSVYHGANIPPYALPGERTKSTIKTSSSPGGGGSNEIRLEDKKGSEEFFVHAQKDLNIAVEHDEARQVGNNRSKQVTGDDSEIVGGDKNITIAQNQTEMIGMDDTLTVTGNLVVAVGGAIAITGGQGGGGGASGGGPSGGNDTTGTFAGDVTLDLQKTMSLGVGADKTESVGGSSIESVSKDKSVTVEQSYALSVSKDGSIKIAQSVREEIGENKTLIVGKELTINVGDATITVKKNGDITVQGKKITVKGSDAISVEGKKLQLKSNGDVSVEASGNVNVKGSNVGVN